VIFLDSSSDSAFPAAPDSPKPSISSPLSAAFPSFGGFSSVTSGLESSFVVSVGSPFGDSFSSLPLSLAGLGGS